MGIFKVSQNLFVYAPMYLLVCSEGCKLIELDDVCMDLSNCNSRFIETPTIAVFKIKLVVQRDFD